MAAGCTLEAIRESSIGICDEKLFDISSNFERILARLAFEVDMPARKKFLKIAANADNDIKPFAMSSWLGCTVTAVNQMMYNQSTETIAYCQECRAFLKEHRGELHYLIKRQRVAALSIIYAPKLHMLLYKLYQKVNRR